MKNPWENGRRCEQMPRTFDFRRFWLLGTRLVQLVSAGFWVGQPIETVTQTGSASSK
jgi:hypothetical protein